MLRTLLKRTDKEAGPSGREVTSLLKMDSLLVLVNVREAKKALQCKTESSGRKNFKIWTQCKL